ncbi:MAG: HD domain-containing phosphohydrolase [Candidatus Omnitrophota bacterium]
MKTVDSYMSKNVITIDSNRSIIDAVIVMRKHEVSSLLVKEGDAIAGIFTERDLLTRVDFNSLLGQNPPKIADVMTKDLKTADHKESYIDILEVMQKFRIRHMPVVKDGCVVGIVSLRDLLDHYYENLEHLLGETITALSSAVEKRDPYTAGHQRRVTQLACAIARALGFREKEVSGVSMASIIHDIGKMYVPADILNKPGKLSEAEFTLIKIHPQVGYDILKSIEFPWPVAEIVLQHHERLDGSGYPKGLTRDEIIFEAKIIAVADVVEAMASHRPYRPARGINFALKEITETKDVLFDSKIVDACIGIFKEKNFIFESEQV